MSIATHCPYCALQCAMTLNPNPNPAEYAATPPVTIAGRAFPTNRGGLCKKGWTAAELLNSPERITEPMARQPDGTFTAVDWKHALDTIACELSASRAEYGADSVAVFGSGGLTNEKAYQLGKFARIALGTSRIDYNGRFCMSSAAAAGMRAFGIDRGLPFPVEHIDSAATVMLLGSNVAATMPPFIAHLAGARAAGGLIVVDPRRSATARLTDDGGGTHLAPTPGSDLALLLGLTHIVIAERLYDAEYVASRTTGFDAITASVGPWWPHRVQAATGIPAGVLRDVARRLASDGGTYILTGRGVEQHIDGTATATAAINLSLLLGLPGSSDSGYGTLTGQGNGQGGREHGQKADQLPGYRKITDPAARRHVAEVWGVHPDSLPGPGIPATALLDEIGSGVRCLLVHGSNVLVSAPDASAVRSKLEQLEMLVVSDFFFSETAALADFVLPVTQWAEEDGTMTSLEGRVIRRRQAVEPPSGVRSELWVMRELAARLESPGVFSDRPAEVFDELARASAGGAADYSGISHELLDTEAQVFWPYPAGSTGTPRLFSTSFGHEDGLARLVPVSPAVRNEPLFQGGMLTLVTGRLLEHYQTGAQTRRVPELNLAQPIARMQIHPVTAQALGIAPDADVEISNRRGRVRAVADVTPDIRRDTVFLPFHFPGDRSANVLTQNATDPVSGMPEFKTTAVHVRARATGVR